MTKSHAGELILIGELIDRVEANTVVEGQALVELVQFILQVHDKHLSPRASTLRRAGRHVRGLATNCVTGSTKTLC